MKLVKTEEAAGMVLSHDITQILPGIKKGPVFKKGHIVREEDIPVLLSCGKEHLYVYELGDGEGSLLHENDAAEILRDLCMGTSPVTMKASLPSEGKIEITAAVDGLFKVDSRRLYGVNSLGEMMIATRQENLPVKVGDKLAGTRIIPLVIESEKMERAKEAAGREPLLSILPFGIRRAGLIITGNEVALGRIRDGFAPVLTAKLSEYGVVVEDKVILPDDREAIRDAVLAFAAKGMELVCVTGGMSVDPDDRTPGAIRDTGAEIISYGAPVLPGAMFLLSYLDAERFGRKSGETVVLGLPGCIMYAKRTVFDLVLPRILAGERLTAGELAAYGEGGLCLSCPVCHFPNCGFGKGSVMI